ncbi:UNVERIFIED_CONTAM: Retrovirus-related Pol polyprotein from transposon RE1 [Sesamum indicum]
MVEEDHCVYVKRSEKNFFIISLYMDDILLAGNNMEIIVATQKWLPSTFEMKDMGEAKYILSVKIHKDRSMKLLSLSQETYIKRIIERFRIHNAHPIDTPMDKSCVLSKWLCLKTEEEKKCMPKILYASIVGSLKYAMSRYQSNLALFYHGGSLKMDGSADRDERKSTSGYAFLLGGVAIT